MKISEKKLYCISVHDPVTRGAGMRIHVVADDHNQATEKANAFFNKKHIPHAGLRDITTISSQCVV